MSSAAPANITSSFPVKRQVTIGSWVKTTHTSQLVQCPDNSHVTKIDFQVIRYNADYPDPFPSGLRIYCSPGGGGLPQPINWRTTATQGNVTTVPGVELADGIRDMIGSGDSYVQLLGYSTVVVGHAGGSLWQQQGQVAAVKSEYAGCKLAGVEALFVQWLDGTRLHFVCPSLVDASSTGCNSTAAAAAASSTSPDSPLSPTPLLIGIAIGSLGSILLGLVAWAVIRRQTIGQRDSTPSPMSPPTSPPSPQTKQMLVKDSGAAPSFSPAFGHAHVVTAANGPIHYQPAGHTLATVSSGATLSMQPPMVYLVQAPQPQQLSPVAGGGVTHSQPPPSDSMNQRRSVASIPLSEKDLILP